MASDGQRNGQYTMEYFTRDDIPFHYALADAFTICDNYHRSVMGSTHPNRYMWTTGGYAASEVFDHTSQLRFVEKITGVKASNISDWRRQTVGDLTSAFRFNQASQAPVLPDTNRRSYWLSSRGERSGFCQRTR
jgi:phospholipase C